MPRACITYARRMAPPLTLTTTRSQQRSSATARPRRSSSPGARTLRSRQLSIENTRPARSSRGRAAAPSSLTRSRPPSMQELGAAAPCTPGIRASVMPRARSSGQFGCRDHPSSGPVRPCPAILGSPPRGVQRRQEGHPGVFPRGGAPSSPRGHSESSSTARGRALAAPALPAPLPPAPQPDLAAHGLAPKTTVRTECHSESPECCTRDRPCPRPAESES
jgi:hypothetical protein